MKKLVSTSIALAGLCAGAIVSLPAFAQGTDGQAAAQGSAANCSQITIKDAAEYNAYANATSQSDPKAKASAIEAFLKQYPNSVAKGGMLADLMDAYRASANAQMMLDAAKRLLQVEPNNLRALTAVVYLEHQSANGNQGMLDDAASVAEQGLNAQKDNCTSQADYDKLKDVATPVFYEAVAADDAAKKDIKGEVDAYTKELQSYKDPTATTQVPALLDTYYLGNAYLQEDPKDIKDAVWFLTRAAQFAQPPYKAQIESAAEYWYKKYHCSQNDAACNATPPQGFAEIQQLSATPANIFPPASYDIKQAPPPPSPADLAHQAISGSAGCTNATPAPPPAAPASGATSADTSTAAATPAAPPSAPAAATTSIPPACAESLKSMALSDKEFILANGAAPDQQAIWSVMNGVTAEIPGVVVSGTTDSVQLAVTQDAQQSNNADFTINMKTPLKEAPKAGEKVTYIATFDSYTAKMIILKDGEPKAAPKAPVHHTTTTHHPAAH
jgi:hypothetical protein